MPIYGYRCKACDHSFEVQQSINDEPVKTCPECQGEVNKIFFPVGIAFKGSGFHINDYKSPRRKAAETKAGDNGGGAGSNGSGNGNGSSCSTCTSASTCATE